MDLNPQMPGPGVLTFIVPCEQTLILHTEIKDSQGCNYQTESQDTLSVPSLHGENVVGCFKNVVWCFSSTVVMADHVLVVPDTAHVRPNLQRAAFLKSHLVLHVLPWYFNGSLFCRKHRHSKCLMVETPFLFIILSFTAFPFTNCSCSDPPLLQATW